MKKTTILIVLAMLCLNFNVNGQRILIANIKGIVLDLNGKPVNGATINLQKGGQTTTSDKDGIFVFKSHLSRDIIKVTYVGYTPVEVGFDKERNTEPYKITLFKSERELSEVEIINTGYQNIAKQKINGSFSSPDKEMFDARVSTDVLSKLEGITGGVAFNSAGITGERKPKISIRGRSTIYANDNPLIVVDNFPYDGDINNINPNDVESVNILKDAAASAIWGVQAGNGVIIITTKKGRKNQKLKIDFNTSFTISEKPNLKYDRNYLDASDFIDLEKTLYTKGKYDQDILQNDPASINSTYTPLTKVIELLEKVKNSHGTFSQEDADYEINSLRQIDVRDGLSKYFYQKAFKQQSSLSFSGGSQYNTYFFSGGYDNNHENKKGNKSNRISLAFNDTFSPFKNLEVTAGLTYVQNENIADNTLDQIFIGGNYTSVTPYTKFVDVNGKSLPVLKQFSEHFANMANQKGYLNWQFRPVEELLNSYNTINTIIADVRINTGLKYVILHGLNAEIKYQFERTSTTNKALATQNSFFARNLINRFATVNNSGNVENFNLPLGGILNGGIGLQSSNRFRGQVNYINSFNKHSINAIAGYETSQVKYDSFGYSLFGYNDELATSGSVNGNISYPLNPGGVSSGTIGGNGGASGTINRFISYYSNAEYTYNDIYTISGSVRTDASNYFGVNANQKKVPLWSTGLSWSIDKEKFYNLNWLPVLKLRSSYGYQGNLDKSLTAITTFQFLSRAQFTNANYASISNYGNPDLRWEKTKMFNLGLDFGLANELVNGSLDYYKKKGIDLIGFSTLAPTSGVTDLKGNYAGSSGQGVDLQLNAIIINRGLKWKSNFLLSWATDRVTKYSGSNITPNILPGSSRSITPVIGRPVFGIYVYKWAGLDHDTGDPQGYDQSGNISKNYGDLINPKSISELTYIGSARPTLFGGLSNHFSHGSFSLSFNITYKFNYYFLRSGINYDALVRQGVGNKEYTSRWRKPGDEKNTNVPSFIYPTNISRDAFYTNSQTLVENGNHIRLQDINLGYEIPKHIAKQLSISYLKFYLYTNNIGIIWRSNNKNIDPDYPIGGVPSSKTFAFGIKAGF